MARKYDYEYKVQAVKPAKEIGGAKAAKELGIPEGTIHTWMKAVRAGKLDIGEGSHTPAGAMSLSEEITMLRKRVKEQDKEIRRLKEENEFLEKTGKNQRMIFPALKTEDAGLPGKPHLTAGCLVSAGRDSANISRTKTVHGSNRDWQMP